MHVIAKSTLVEFYERYCDAEGSLKAWYYEAQHAQWSSSADIKTKYKSASILRNNRVVFNIAGNKYRLIVRINYDSKTVFIRFIGTHKEYDKINAEVI